MQLPTKPSAPAKNTETVPQMEFVHPYFPLTRNDEQHMLAAVGVSSVDSLFDSIPADLRLGRDLNLPSGMSELEIRRWFRKLAAKNASADRVDCYLGAGSYERYIPAAVPQLAGRAEFYTAYTPYQPEMTQGMLQAIYEYQSCICALTGMDISNASVYDGGHALAESVLLAVAAQRRKKVLLSEGVHPEYRAVVQTYLRNMDVEIETIPLAADGRTDAAALQAALNDQVAAVAVASPNFLGLAEDWQQAADQAHAVKALLIAVAQPVSLGLLKAPGECGADIACGEGQELGNAMNFGGPGLGFLAVTKALMRRMPGRLCGRTTDVRGQQGFVLTLQTREQHIRREKATSKFCTNQSLAALTAAVYMAGMGPEGIHQAALQSHQKAAWLAGQLAEVPGITLVYAKGWLQEFVIRVRDAAAFCAAMEAQDILAGICLEAFDPQRAGQILVCVTETKDRAQLDRYVSAARQAGGAA